MPLSLHNFLEHIDKECEYILRSTEGKSRDEVFSDETLSRAIIRSLEIIGEAVKHLDDDFRLKHPAIEWKKIAGTRDIVIHEYFGVDYEIVWSIITTKIVPPSEYIKSITG